MLTLSYDGKSVYYMDEAPFAPSLQYARLEFTDGKPDPEKDVKGLKGDITYLASDSSYAASPLLVAHLHHNHIGAFYLPYVTADLPSQVITRLREDGQFANNYHPEDHNDYMHKAKSHNPLIDNPDDIRINRIPNYVLHPFDAKPNPYSLRDRIIKPIEEKGRPHAKLPLNNDVLAVYGNPCLLPAFKG